MELLSLEPQEDLVDLAAERYQRVAESGRGRLFFIAGQIGTGRSATLELIGRRLAYADPPPLVVRGSLAADEFRDLSNRREDQRQLLETLAGLLGLAAVAQPYLGLVAAVMLAASGAAQAREQLRKGKLAGLTQAEAPKLLLKLLREEAAKRPVALLLDDVDQGSDVWLTGFLDSLAIELPVDVRALVVVTLIGSERPDPKDAGRLMQIARHEVEERQLADWRSLPETLTDHQIEGWLGAMAPRLLHDLMRATDGNLALVAGLWSEWEDGKLVTWTDPLPEWRFVPGSEDEAARWIKAPTESRLRALLGDDGAAFHRLWDALGLAALEGRTFTAEGLAGALHQPLPPDDLIDELDDRIAMDEEREQGLVEEAGFVQLTAVRALRRYRFSSDLLWRMFRHYLAPEQGPELCQRLADALVAAYAPYESQVSRLVAKLYTEAGAREQADRYQVMADLRGSVDALKAQGNVLLGMPTENWERWHFIDAARNLNELARLLWDHDELNAAQPLLERALDIRERVLGTNHPDTALSISNLGVVLRELGESDTARPLLERALEVRGRLLGPDHPNTARSLNNLALLLQDQGEADAARTLLERALDIRERVLGPDHPDTADSLNNLGVMLGELGKSDAARTLFERALEIRERVLGPDHPDTANSLNNLASLLQDQGDLDGARRLYERALEIRERVLGPDHLDTAASRQAMESL
jgi:tetratricopeptide (TPR) repeat protein